MSFRVPIIITVHMHACSLYTNVYNLDRHVPICSHPCDMKMILYLRNEDESQEESCRNKYTSAEDGLFYVDEMIRN